MDLSLVRKIQELEQRLDRLNLPEIGGQPVFLTTAYTNATFNGDSFSDVGANTKIENTSWSTTIPANAKALLIRCACRDSGSAADNSVFMALCGAAAATEYAMIVRPSGLPNDYFADGSSIVPCTDGDIWYIAGASGANTLDVWLECFGYWL